MSLCKCCQKDPPNPPVDYEILIDESVLEKFIESNSSSQSMKHFYKFGLHRVEHECVPNGEEFYVKCVGVAGTHKQKINKETFISLIKLDKIRIVEEYNSKIGLQNKTTNKL